MGLTRLNGRKPRQTKFLGAASRYPRNPCLNFQNFCRHSILNEETIFNNTANLFKLDVELIFYDTTTASFSIDYEDEDIEDIELSLRKRGKAKEGDWSLQVVVALAVTHDGLPVSSWVFPRNTTDVTTVKKIRSDLRGWKLSRALFVADSGMNSKDNGAESSRVC